MTDASDIGPVEFMIVAFPGSRFTGQIAPALQELVDAGTIRIVDIAFVTKDEAGETAAVELMELDPEVREGLERMGLEPSGMFSDDDLALAAEELDPGTSAALLVWENVWAKGVLHAMRDAGGVLIASDRIPHEVVVAAREYVLANA
jgi:hypothetical protein